VFTDREGRRMCLESFAGTRYALSMARSGVMTHPKHLERNLWSSKEEIPQGSVGRSNMV
jgi:hypothetical protein